MTDIRTIADRVEIEALRGEFADAAMMGDYDRFAALFTDDGVWRIPDVVEFTGPADIRAGVERLQDHWEFFYQTTHPGHLEVDGDTATGRTYIFEFGKLVDGQSHLNYSLYHDGYRRTPDGWKFTMREFEVKYHDSTPLTGVAGVPRVVSLP